MNMTQVESKNGPTFGTRHVQVLLLFFGIVVLYLGRVNLSVAIVAMTNAETTNPDFDEFDWTEKEKSYILSSFYWGNVVTQLPGGLIGRRYGSKITMLVSAVCSSILILLTPETVRWGDWPMFCGIRVLQGLFQGVMFPCIHQHLAKWAPEKERNRLGALSHSGVECGTVMAMLISGLIAASSLGWPGISYFCGLLGLVWALLWFIFSSNSPAESKYCSVEERKYIEANLTPDCVSEGNRVPWRAIFTSVPFIALVVARCSESWGFTTLQAEIPSYMNGVLLMEIKKNALFSALPYLVMWIMSYINIAIADVLLRKKILSLSAVRKTFNSIAFWIPAAALIAVGFVGEDHKTLAVVLMTVNIGINSGATIGSTLNTIDLSPNYAGMLMAILNSLANILPILTPLVVGFIVTDEHDRTQWQIVFIIAAVVFIVGNTFYITFGTAVTQPWNEPGYRKGDKENLEAAVDKVKSGPVWTIDDSCNLSRKLESENSTENDKSEISDSKENLTLSNTNAMEGIENPTFETEKKTM